VRVALSEVLSGGLHAPLPAHGTQAVTLHLEVLARGVVECALGAPFEVKGRIVALPPTSAEAAFLPAESEVRGTLRFFVSSGLHYDLLDSTKGPGLPGGQLSLRGARRFVRGDLVASATTFEGELVGHGHKLADVRLRFDVRDDVPKLLRSLRRAS
jgi:hypothetical protein